MNSGYVKTELDDKKVVGDGSVKALDLNIEQSKYMPASVSLSLLVPSCIYRRCRRSQAFESFKKSFHSNSFWIQASFEWNSKFQIPFVNDLCFRSILYYAFHDQFFVLPTILLQPLFCRCLLTHLSLRFLFQNRKQRRRSWRPLRIEKRSNTWVRCPQWL